MYDKPKYTVTIMAVEWKKKNTNETFPKLKIDSTQADLVILI